MSLSMGESGPKDYDPKFYEQFYHITPQEREFFLAQTGIKDDEELKRHIMRVQEDALKVTLYSLDICMQLTLHASTYRSPDTPVSGFLLSQSMILHFAECPASPRHAVLTNIDDKAHSCPPSCLQSCP